MKKRTGTLRKQMDRQSWRRGSGRATSQQAGLDQTHLGNKTPLKKRKPKTKITRFASISPQSMATYGLLRGFLLRLVCLIASQTVKKPKPMLKPTAMEPTVSSWPPLILAAAMNDQAFVQQNSPPGSRRAVACGAGKGEMVEGVRYRSSPLWKQAQKRNPISENFQQPSRPSHLGSRQQGPNAHDEPCSLRKSSTAAPYILLSHQQNHNPGCRGK